MTTNFEHPKSDFYLTAPAPCPYLKGKRERKIFSFLSGPTAHQVNSRLTERGFRRSQNIVYLPACDACKACVPLRVKARDFEFRGSRKRILNRNQMITRTVLSAQATPEQFSLLRDYLDSRHADGGMADMTVLDYTAMVEQTSVNTVLIEYRIHQGTPYEKLIACALSDRLDDGISMVYSFFAPNESARSLGKYMIMDHVRYAQEHNLSHVYLGYWVKGSPKMDYKRDFQPLEHLTSKGWRDLKDD